MDSSLNRNSGCCGSLYGVRAVRESKAVFKPSYGLWNRLPETWGLKPEVEDKLALSSISPPGTLDGSEVDVLKSGLLISLCGAAEDGSCGLVRLKVSSSPMVQRSSRMDSTSDLAKVYDVHLWRQRKQWPCWAQARVWRSLSPTLFLSSAQSSLLTPSCTLGKGSPV